MDDVLIIGGGVIGLSLAWDLAKHGRSVRVIDQSDPGSEASWAGAGILPPAVLNPSQHPSEQLRGLACQLHPQWAAELQSLTGIDTGYRRCGGLHLARTPGEAAALAAWADLNREEGIEVVRLSNADLHEIEPGIAEPSISTRAAAKVFGIKPSVPSRSPIAAAFLLPNESQLRNPRHLKALAAACQLTGVRITPNVAASELIRHGEELAGVPTSAGLLRAKNYCFAAGSWTGQMLKWLGISVGILPIRGQIVLFHCQKAPISRIVNEGSRYVVPRDDGHVLAGSTEEEVGFDKRTTEEAIGDITDFARSLVPALRDAPIERTWAGLRPGSFDGLPYLGSLPGLKNAFVAAGHFRTGLYLSPATAVVMSRLIRGEEPQIDLAPFRVGR